MDAVEDWTAVLYEATFGEKPDRSGRVLAASGVRESVLMAVTAEGATAWLRVVRASPDEGLDPYLGDLGLADMLQRWSLKVLGRLVRFVPASGSKQQGVGCAASGPLGSLTLFAAKDWIDSAPIFPPIDELIVLQVELPALAEGEGILAMAGRCSAMVVFRGRALGGCLYVSPEALEFSPEDDVPKGSFVAALAFDARISGVEAGRWVLASEPRGVVLRSGPCRDQALWVTHAGRLGIRLVSGVAGSGPRVCSPQDDEDDATTIEIRCDQGFVRGNSGSGHD